MKQNVILKSSLILSIFLFFLSCKNSEEVNITPEEKLTTQIRGKWEIDDFPLIKFQTQINKNTKQNEIEIIPSVSSKIESSKGKKASLEFIDTENYILIDSNSAFWFGKYQVLSSTAILLERFGEIAEIEVDERTLKFKSNYLGLNQTVSAVKAEKVMSNARNSLFCRRWSVDLERYKKDNGELFWDDQDLAISNSPDGKLLNKSELIFTEYGTYIKTDYFNNLVFKRTFDNWQWNKTKGDNHIVFGDYDNNYTSSLENYVQDLTKDKMKATLSLHKIINKKHLYEPKTIVFYPSE